MLLAEAHGERGKVKMDWFILDIIKRRKLHVNYESALSWNKDLFDFRTTRLWICESGGQFETLSDRTEELQWAYGLEDGKNYTLALEVQEDNGSWPSGLTMEPVGDLECFTSVTSGREWSRDWQAKQQEEITQVTDACVNQVEKPTIIFFSIPLFTSLFPLALCSFIKSLGCPQNMIKPFCRRAFLVFVRFLFSFFGIRKVSHWKVSTLNHPAGRTTMQIEQSLRLSCFDKSRSEVTRVKVKVLIILAP